MKKVIFSLAIMITASVSLTAQTVKAPDAHQVAQPAPIPATPVVDKNAPLIVFKVDTINYGTIEHNADGNREFKFKNKGKQPLVISSCQGSCGCTVPTWPKEPIMPGKTGVIHVKYATDRVGHFEKNVTVNSNASNSRVVVYIKGDVKPDPTPATQAPADNTKH